MERKRLRLKEFDYNSQGTYFLTLCTQDRKCLFCEIQTETGDDFETAVVLYKEGETVKKYIEQLNEFYNELSVDSYVIMPNHIHFLLTVYQRKEESTPQNTAVAKFVSTLKRFVNKEIGFNIWQKGSYDHIVRDEADYVEHLEYMENNPSKWNEDKYYMK